jgi:hypothetical protein
LFRQGARVNLLSLASPLAMADISNEWFLTSEQVSLIQNYDRCRFTKCCDGKHTYNLDTISLDCNSIYEEEYNNGEIDDDNPPNYCQILDKNHEDIKKIKKNKWLVNAQRPAKITSNTVDVFKGIVRAKPQVDFFFEKFYLRKFNPQSSIPTSRLASESSSSTQEGLDFLTLCTQTQSAGKNRFPSILLRLKKL